MNALFNPAIALLNRLKYPQKFALISLLFAVPLALAMVLLVVQLNKDVAFAQQELAGTAYLRPLHRLFTHMIFEEQLANDYANGNPAVKDVLFNNQAQIDNDLEALHTVDMRFGVPLSTTTQLNTLVSSWNDLKARTLTMRARQSDDMHDGLIAAIRELISQIGDTSNLILDPSLDSYYTMDVMLLKLPEGADLLAETRDLGKLIAEQHAVSASDRARLIILSGLVQANMEQTRHSVETMFRANPALREPLATPYKTYIDAANNFLTRTNREIIYAPTISITPDVYTSAANNVVDVNTTLWNGSVDILDRLLQDRIDGLNRQQYVTLSITLLGLAIVIYLWVAFYLGVMRTVLTLDAAAQRMIGGDMHGVVRLDNRDELGQVARSFNDIATALVAASTQRQAVVDNAVDGILTVNEQGIIQSFNPAATHLFGCPADQAIGQSIATLIPAPHDHEYRVVGMGREVLGLRSDGTTFPLELAVGEMRLGEQHAFVAIAHDLTERKRADAEREQFQEQIIRAQAATLAELSTPVIPITDEVLVVPLIGAIDTQRADQVLQALLYGVEQRQARTAILDITGVPVVDTYVARTLITAAQGVRLLGAQVVITGIRPEVAQTLVSLGIDLSSIVTRSTLQSGIAYATRHARTR